MHGITVRVLISRSCCSYCLSFIVFIFLFYK
uniref:Uncharacterized protein n=1 Tax=Arundo donax TaxID=35708 RepID=A0A0A9GY79_ARUDO